MALGDTFDVAVRYYADDGTWTAVSDDIRGLAVEAESLPDLHTALDEVATELLLHNTQMTREEVDASTLRITVTIILSDTRNVMVEGVWTGGSFQTRAPVLADNTLPLDPGPCLVYKPRLAFG